MLYFFPHSNNTNLFRSSLCVLLVAQATSINIKLVDPTAENNEALCEAVKNNHKAVVGLLLSDSRVNPSTVTCDLMSSASADMKSVLLENRRVKRGGKFTRKLKRRKQEK